MPQAQELRVKNYTEKAMIPGQHNLRDGAPFAIVREEAHAK
jgi:hypothetical protein